MGVKVGYREATGLNTFTQAQLHQSIPKCKAEVVDFFILMHVPFSVSSLLRILVKSMRDAREEGARYDELLKCV